MTLVAGIDLGSTTTKAILMDEGGAVVGRGITNSRSNYHLATRIAMDEATINARFGLLRRDLEATSGLERDPLLGAAAEFLERLELDFRRAQYLMQLDALRDSALQEAAGPGLAARSSAITSRLGPLFDEMAREAHESDGHAQRSQFFRDESASRFGEHAQRLADRDVPYDLLLGIFDKAIGQVEGRVFDRSFERCIRSALAESRLPGAEPRTAGSPTPTPRAALRAAVSAAVARILAADVEPAVTIGTGYGRQRLPFPKEQIRSEILCHGLGAHSMFPGTRTVLDIGGQDTKAIQVDDRGIVTSFQMNDRCAAGCGRYLGYIADEMNLGVHELGPLAQQSTRSVKITSTCTVFAGAELRDRLTLGQRREDILAGLHRAMMLRAMSLLARSGGIEDEFTFTGGVASNPAAVDALTKLVGENYGSRRINISPGSIYTGALGAALFARTVLRERRGD